MANGFRILSGLLAGAAFAALLPAVPAMAQAQANSAYTQGRTARLSGNLALAETKLRAAVAAEPSNYLATYNLGLVFVQRGETGREPQRSAAFRTATEWLEKARALREVQKIDEFTIYNTLGTAYLALGDLARAEAMFKAGLANKAKLPQRSQAKLHSNLGYLYGMQGKSTEARAQLAAGAKLGSVNAAANLSKLDSVIARAAPAPARKQP